jgi:DNA-binding MarR family transcriptional regulator
VVTEDSPDCAPAAFGAEIADLRTMDAAARRRLLVAQTARFAGTFLRWADTLASPGLTYPRLRLLDALHCGGPVIMRELADKLGISARNMTSMVDALEEARLVERRPHPTDRRATLIQLTSGGLGAAQTALQPELDAMAQLFQDFSPEDEERFLAILSRLSDAMRCPDEPMRGGYPAAAPLSGAGNVP